ENKANGVFFSLDGKSINKNTLIQNYGQPNSYSPTSAWGEVYKYKIGNKDVHFYVDRNGYVIKGQIMSE
ncbi:hypothetical protein ACEY4Z_13615, partial [Staphylococcus aureus]